MRGFVRFIESLAYDAVSCGFLWASCEWFLLMLEEAAGEIAEWV